MRRSRSSAPTRTGRPIAELPCYGGSRAGTANTGYREGMAFLRERHERDENHPMCAADVVL